MASLNLNSQRQGPSGTATEKAESDTSDQMGTCSPQADFPFFCRMHTIIPPNPFLAPVTGAFPHLSRPYPLSIYSCLALLNFLPSPPCLHPTTCSYSPPCPSPLPCSARMQKLPGIPGHWGFKSFRGPTSLPGVSGFAPFFCSTAKLREGPNPDLSPGESSRRPAFIAWSSQE